MKVRPRKGRGAIALLRGSMPIGLKTRSTEPGDQQSAMPKAVTEIRSLARSHTRTALNVLVAVMRNTKATPPARVAAANAILDRGWGKPTQSLGNDENAIELIHRIERVIVQPEHAEAD
jgi:hypothetical protein